MKKQILTFTALSVFLCLSAFFTQKVIKTNNAQAAEPAIVVSVFETKLYDLTNADAYFVKYAGTKSGQFSKAVTGGLLPFSISVADEKTANSIISSLETNICGGAGKCDAKGFVAKYSAGSVVPLTNEWTSLTATEALTLAKTRQEEMFKNFNTCQKTAYSNMENLARSYVTSVKNNNTSYYSTMAPVTSDFIKNYRQAANEFTRQTLMEAYHTASISNRSRLYVDQSTISSKFISDLNTSKTTFNSCK
ncbi:MAG TPA: hypothetical protein PKN62_00945 [bacterium]|nr:hypothetical protein [bacterium]